MAAAYAAKIQATGAPVIDVGIAHADLLGILTANAGAIRALLTDDNKAGILGLTQGQVAAFTDAQLVAIRDQQVVKDAMAAAYLQNDLITRPPLGNGAGIAFSQTTVDAIAKANTGAELKAALTAANPAANIDQNAIDGIDDGIINNTAAGNVNAPLLALRKAATKQALESYMDTARDDGLVNGIARAKAGTGNNPTLADAIRNAIKATPALAAFTVADSVLDGGDVEAIQKKAIAKHNELMLSRMIDRVVDDKDLLNQFINAQDDAVRRTLLSAHKDAFGVNLCVVIDPDNITSEELPPEVLTRLKTVAQSRVRELTNAAGMDSKELLQRVNAGIPEGWTQYLYNCKHVTDPQEIARARSATLQAADQGAAMMHGGASRIEVAVKANHLTTWVKAAVVTAGNPVNVVVVREPNGTMQSTNSAADLARLTELEKTLLAKQMAQEYVANMMTGKKIYISCGDESLGKKLYAAVLAIQMEAQKACSESDVNKSIKTIAKVEIVPPAGVESLSNSRNGIKETFIEKNIGKKASDMAREAIWSYYCRSKKLTAHETAQEGLSKAEKALEEHLKGGPKWWGGGTTKFAATKAKLEAAKTEAAEKAAKSKGEVLSSEVEKEGQERPPVPGPK